MNFSNFISMRRELHKIPEIGYKEWKTQEYLLNYIHTLPTRNLTIHTWKTGIFVLIKGTNPSKMIGYRADIDALPIEEETHLPFSSSHPGYMHACGHDFHMSIALGILTHFCCHPIQDDLLFIFQPAEEGPGGALPMMQTEFFQQHKPDQIFALHIAPELPVGTISTKSGILFANSCEVEVTFHGQKGHAAFPHLANDMIVATSHFITQIQSVISRNVNPLDSGVITFGKMNAGSANNVISDYAHLHGTLRTLSKDSMNLLIKRVKEIANGIKHSFQCHDVVVEFHDEYLQVHNDEKKTNEFISFAKQQSYVSFQEAPIAMTAEDFGYFIDEIPGFMFWLGVDSPSGLHTSTLNPKEEAIPLGIQLGIDYIQTISK